MSNNLSDGTIPLVNNSCSIKYSYMASAAWGSNKYSLISHSITFSLGYSVIISDTILLNLATSNAESKARGSISENQLGTVGRIPSTLLT